MADEPAALDRLSPTERASFVQTLAAVLLAAALREPDDDGPPPVRTEEVVVD